MRLATFTTIIGIAILANAIADLDRISNGTVIVPLARRSSLWSEGSNNVDFDKLCSHVRVVETKILHGLENYQRNTGISHPLATRKTESLKNKRDISIGSGGLTTKDNAAWYTTITIGTPPKSFTVQIDTGSTDLFVPTPTCLNCEEERARWDPSLSGTAQDKSSKFNIYFEDEAAVSGEQYTDNVTIAGLTADVQAIGAATLYSGNLQYPPDGMLGMAFQSISQFPASPLFKTLVDERKVAEQLFSIKLTSTGGELYLGGSNGNLYDGDISFTPVTIPGFWQVNIANIRGNRKIYLRDIAAIIDTGTNYIVGDRSHVWYLHKSLGGKRYGRGFYTFPCNKFPTISLNFGSRTFRIPANLINLGRVSDDSPDCWSGIVATRKFERHWTIGTVFLKGFYTVFDLENERVGFADLRT